MSLQFLTLSFLLLLHETSAASSFGDQFTVKLCSRNETVIVNLLTKYDSSGIIAQCQATQAIDPPAKENYFYTPGIGAYRIHTEPKKWNDARKVCLGEDAHLAIINSKAEETILLDMLRKAADTIIKKGAHPSRAFLGIHDLYEEGDWLTIFGEPLSSTGFSHWFDKGQPDNYQNNQNCGVLVDRGGLDDVGCYQKYAFFCELPVTC